MGHFDKELKGAIGAQFYARGEKDMPRGIEIKGHGYEFVREFKHDFFAVTGLYKLKNDQNYPENGIPEKVVLKISREKNLFGLPFEWFGEGICENEIINLTKLSGLDQVPKLLGRWKRCGLVYEYIEGKNLHDAEQLPEDFFDNLQELLNKIHERRLVYLDMNKRNNILLGDDGKPHMIDFQVCIRIGRRLLVFRKLSDWLHRWLTKGDKYHLYKHKRKLQPELLTDEERKLSYLNSKFIKFHRFVATPVRKLRRAFLDGLAKSGCLFRGRQQD